ncbi:MULTISPECIES: hemolysin family protein [unclassified Crossiella]|uniref:hemolysin family protein n=1 Tax=unclassified Crossiella TaxID=2620835 RepID=UPI001FFF2AD0|nr:MULTISPECIES: hemolysin family protein [unclassified Crossiella]MCK2242053.1 hemolysin family protein [Crossiella sp. S99.2]MCK2255956.1 hemolysin family protein [Crossiella sp. S99.1]
MSGGTALIVSLLLLGLNAFFVGAEFALISARRDRLEALADAGSAGARTVIRASEQISLMLAGAQLGITLCSIALGAIAKPAVAAHLSPLLLPLGVPEAVADVLAFIAAVLIVVVLHIVLGEMVPKNIAIAGPERTSLRMVPALVFFVRLVRPVITVLNWLANGVLRLLKVEPKDEIDTAYTPTELSELIAESRREGLLDDSEHRRLTQTLSSAQRTVADVLVPLDKLTTVPERPTVGDVQQAVVRTGYSRFPVRTATGSVRGYLHVKDVLDLASADPATPVPLNRIRGLPELPADARLDEAVAALRRAQSHLAGAVAADGAVLGVVALEDLVEEYVGTVRDATHVPS